MKKVLLAAVLVTAAACEREARNFQGPPPPPPPVNAIRVTDFVPGGSSAGAPYRSPYQGNAYGLSEGKRLFAAMNCSGCHAHGGGGIGPALMDEKWIYGGRPEQIFATIVQGRPNGMPSYGGKLPEDQVWQIVAYIQSLSAQVPRDAAPSRDDDMSVMKPELRLEAKPGVQTGHR
jgi:cytochrome c oxidase cbb3-type subunit 3